MPTTRPIAPLARLLTAAVALAGCAGTPPSPPSSPPTPVAAHPDVRPGCFPGEGFGTVVLCNTTADVHAIEAPLLERWVASRGGRAPTPTVEAIALPAGMAERLAGTYHAAGDDLTLELVAHEGTLALMVYGTALPLTHRGDGRFVLEGAGEWRFGEVDGQVTVVEHVPNQADLVYAKLPPFEAHAASQLAGTHRSTDVDGELVVRADDGGLTLVMPSGPVALRQIGPDAFAAPEQGFAHVAFTRGAEGAVEGLVLTVTWGITRMRFARVAGSDPRPPAPEAQRLRGRTTG